MLFILDRGSHRLRSNMARAWSWVLCFLVSVECVVCYQFTVGGSKGWGLPSPSDNETYNQWAGRNRFQIGDTLLFKYDNTVDSVAQVKQESYNNCNATGPIASYTTGNTVFKFPINGPFYFISGNESRCQLGEKLILVVLAPCHMGKGKNCKRAPAPSPLSPYPSQSPQLSPNFPIASSPSPTPSPFLTSPALSPASPSPSLASPTPSPTPTASSPSPSPSPISPALSSSPSPTPMGSSPSPSPSLSSPASSPSPSPLASPASSPSLSPSPSLTSPASSPSPDSSSPPTSPDSSSPPLPSATPPSSPTSTPSASSPTLPLPSLLIPLLFATLINARIISI